MAGKKKTTAKTKRVAPAKKAARKTAKKTAKKPAKKTAAKTASPKTAAPKLLSGGNPQIAKGYGEAPVAAYLDAMPGWKQAIGRRVDALIVRAAPGVRKAVKWNSPFYGVEEGLWFLCFHCFTNYVRVTFFRGGRFDPPPAGLSKYPDVRYYDIREGALDEAQFSDWVRQASRLPGAKM